MAYIYGNEIIVFNAVHCDILDSSEPFPSANLGMYELEYYGNSDQSEEYIKVNAKRHSNGIDFSGALHVKVGYTAKIDTLIMAFKSSYITNENLTVYLYNKDLTITEIVRVTDIEINGDMCAIYLPLSNYETNDIYMFFTYTYEGKRYIPTIYPFDDGTSVYVYTTQNARGIQSYTLSRANPEGQESKVMTFARRETNMDDEIVSEIPSLNDEIIT